MRRIVLITAVALVVGACTKESSPIAPGLLIGEIRVGAQPGSVSVSVETTGRWKVCVDGTAGWVGTDVICGKDNGAFTLNYDSNTSDMSDIRPSRRARILLITEEQSRCDTLLLSQRGFGSNLPSCKVSDAPGVKIEFQVPALRTMEIAYCSAAGLEAESALAQWASSFDVVACGDHFLEPEAGTPIPGADASVITFGGINFVAADFSSSENKDAMFRELLEQTINILRTALMLLLSRPNMHGPTTCMIVCGSLSRIISAPGQMRKAAIHIRPITLMCPEPYSPR